MQRIPLFALVLHVVCSFVCPVAGGDPVHPGRGPTDPSQGLPHGVPLEPADVVTVDLLGLGQAIGSIYGNIYRAWRGATASFSRWQLA